MSEPKVEVLFRGRKAFGTEVGIKSSREEWSEYALEDGTILKFKAVAVKIVRLDEFDDLGNPIYSISSQNLATAMNIPDDLKRKS